MEGVNYLKKVNGKYISYDLDWLLQHLDEEFLLLKDLKEFREKKSSVKTNKLADAINECRDIQKTQSIIDRALLNEDE